MDLLLHKAEERGGGEFGWLKTRYSFSFSNWYSPTRMGFGALRVLNDDIVAPMSGFAMHSHDNFEIITIVTKGVVTHEDSLGNTKEVHAGEVQSMSAGIGVTHAELNNSKDEPLELFQLWIEPSVRGVTPRYAQAGFSTEDAKNMWQVLVSGDDTPLTLPIYQDARIARSYMEEGKNLSYTFLYPGNGAYIFVIDGEIEIEGILLNKKDALGISNREQFLITAKSASRVLLIEVPM